MLNFTDRAKEKIQAFINGADEKENSLLRVVIASRGAQGFDYQFFLDNKKNKKTSDEIHNIGPFEIIMDSTHVADLKGATVDWVENAQGSGFHVDNPNSTTIKLKGNTAEKVKQLIDKEINPALASHGGFIELVEVKDNRAHVKMGGGCHGCAGARATLKQGVESRVKELIPEITELVDMTDHATGTDPYSA